MLFSHSKQIPRTKTKPSYEAVQMHIHALLSITLWGKLWPNG